MNTFPIMLYQVKSSQVKSSQVTAVAVLNLLKVSLADCDFPLGGLVEGVARPSDGSSNPLSSSASSFMIISKVLQQISLYL